MDKKDPIQTDPWAALKAFTAARIALGRTGTAEPLEAMLQFRLAHALARDAVYASLDKEFLLKHLEAPSYLLHSKAANRTDYLQYPDRGRKLDDASVTRLQNALHPQTDLCIVLADGLSATAVNKNAIPVLQHLLPLLTKAGISFAPVCLVEQGRVAIGDEVGWLLNAQLVVILIGERPGLSSPDSLGAYLTYHPQPGLTDESRNCISNIRADGLSHRKAADKLLYLIQSSLLLRLSGLELKDNYGQLPDSR